MVEDSRLSLFDKAMFVYTIALIGMTGMSRAYIVPNVLLVFALASYLLYWFERRSFPTPNIVTILFGVVLIGSSIPVFLGKAVNMDLAIQHVVRSAQILVFIYLFDAWIRDRSRLKLFVIAGAAGFLFAYVYGHLILHNQEAGRATALYDNPNGAAFWAYYTILIISQLVLSYWHRIHELSWPLRVLLMLAALTGSHLIWASQSRKTLLALALLGSAMLVWTLLRSRFKLVFAGLLLVAGIAGAGYLARTLDADELTRLTRPVLKGKESRELSFNKREEFYETGWRIITKEPMIGHGGGAFLEMGRQYSPQIDRPIDTHSVFLDVFIESGITGIAGYLLLLLLLARMPFLHASNSLIAVATLASLAGMLVIQAGASVFLDKYIWLVYLCMGKGAVLWPTQAEIAEFSPLRGT